MDLRTGWDLYRSDHRAAVIKYIEQEKPRVVIGSPPCTMFPSLQHFNSCSPESQRRRRRALVLLRLAVKVYRLQAEAGRYYVHEHPATASSWKEKELKDFAGQEETITVTSDLCMFGLTTKGSSPEEQVAARKRT